MIAFEYIYRKLCLLIFDNGIIIVVLIIIVWRVAKHKHHLRNDADLGVRFGPVVSVLGYYFFRLGFDPSRRHTLPYSGDVGQAKHADFQLPSTAADGVSNAEPLFCMQIKACNERPMTCGTQSPQHAAHDVATL